MADLEMKPVWFAVKRLDLGDTDVSDIVSVNLCEDDKVSEVTQSLRSKLDLNNPDLILRLRNSRGSIIPLNGKITLTSSTNSRPFLLEVVQHFQSECTSFPFFGAVKPTEIDLEPKPNSLELTQYAESLKSKLSDIQDRLSLVEASMDNLHEKRQDKIQLEISKLENTVKFLKKRIEETESIEWRGMFVKNPLW